eukprot:2549626-Pyramimonas_sp.AAC.1
MPPSRRARPPPTRVWHQPQMPNDIVPDDPLQVVGADDLSYGSRGQDAAAAEFARRDAIRRHA